MGKPVTALRGRRIVRDAADRIGAIRDLEIEFGVSLFSRKGNQLI